MPKKRWQKPLLHNHDQDDHEHRVTWLELFYDLVFVITIAQLTHELSYDISLTGITKFILLFIPVWWAWIGMTFYTDRFETDDISQRLFTFLSIIGVASLAYFIPHALDKGTTGFVLSYAFIRTLIIFLWVRAGYHNPAFRPHSNRYLLGYLPAIAIWIASLWVPPPFRYLFWGVSLLVEYITPLTTIKIKNRITSLKRSPHLSERFGLFMIIVLGESLVAIVRGLSELPAFSWNGLLIAALGAAFVFTIWWLYFDHINEHDINPGTNYLALWSYGHFPLVMSIAALGAGILHVIEQSGTVLDQETIWIVCGTVAIALFSMGIIELTLKKSEHGPCDTTIGKLTRFGGGGLCLLLPFLPIGQRPATLLSILIIIFALQIIQGESSPGHVHVDEDRSYIN